MAINPPFFFFFCYDLLQRFSVFRTSNKTRNTRQTEARPKQRHESTPLQLSFIWSPKYLSGYQIQTPEFVPWWWWWRRRRQGRCRVGIVVVAVGGNQTLHRADTQRQHTKIVTKSLNFHYDKIQVILLRQSNSIQNKTQDISGTVCISIGRKWQAPFAHRP